MILEARKLLIYLSVRRTHRQNATDTSVLKPAHTDSATTTNLCLHLLAAQESFSLSSRRSKKKQ